MQGSPLSVVLSAYFVSSSVPLDLCKSSLDLPICFLPEEDMMLESEVSNHYHHLSRLSRNKEI